MLVAPKPIVYEKDKIKLHLTNILSTSSGNKEYDFFCNNGIMFKNRKLSWEQVENQIGKENADLLKNRTFVSNYLKGIRCDNIDNLNPIKNTTQYDTTPAFLPYDPWYGLYSALYYGMWVNNFDVSFGETTMTREPVQAGGPLYPNALANWANRAANTAGQLQIGTIYPPCILKSLTVVCVNVTALETIQTQAIWGAAATNFMSGTTFSQISWSIKLLRGKFINNLWYGALQPQYLLVWNSDDDLANQTVLVVHNFNRGYNAQTANAWNTVIPALSSRYYNYTLLFPQGIEMNPNDRLELVTGNPVALAACSYIYIYGSFEIKNKKFRYEDYPQFYTTFIPPPVNS